MNHKKFQIAIDAQSSIARKVLSVVPIAESWTVGQITGELFRQTQSRTDARIVDGCLTALVDAGLAKEGPARQYQRIMPKEEKENEPKPEIECQQPVRLAFALPSTETPEAPTKGPEQSGFDILCSAAARLTKMSRELSEVADMVEDATMAMGLEISKAKEENFHVEQRNQQLNQLAALLKDLTL